MSFSTIFIFVLAILSAACAASNPDKPQDVSMQARFQGCIEGSQRCTGADGTSQTYYKCVSGVFTLFTCGGGSVCSNSRCVPSGSQPSGCPEGARRCVGGQGSAFYYVCSNGNWNLNTCGSGYVCAAGGFGQISCQPATPPCVSGQQKCVGPRAYLSCVGGQWTTSACKPGDRCINIPGNMINCQVGGGRRARHNLRESALMIVPSDALI